MKPKSQILFPVWCLGFYLLILWSCTGSSQPTQFYLLRPLPESAEDQLKANGPSIEVGPITVPAYLEQNHITTANGHALHMAEFHRWAEPLKEGIERVLAENIALLLDTVNVYTLPRPRGIMPAYQVAVTISRFDASSSGKATLVAYWTIHGNHADSVICRKRSIINREALSGQVEAIVAAQNETLLALSQEIAMEVEKHHQTAGEP